MKTRGRNSAADSKGGSTFVDAGSIPVGSTIYERRAMALRLVAEINQRLFKSTNGVAFMANWSFKSPDWIRRRLRHMGHWCPDRVIRLLGAKAKALAPGCGDGVGGE